MLCIKRRRGDLMSSINYRQKIIMGSVIGVIVVLISIFYYVNVQATDEQSSHIEVMHGDIIDGYETVKELQDAADIVAQVEVSESSNIVYDELPFTLNTSTVKKVYKGQEKESIDILETGGFIDDIEYTFEENPVLKKKEKAVVFLQKYEGPIASDAYVILGVFQGKFKLKDGKLEPSKDVDGELETIYNLDSLEDKLN